MTHTPSKKELRAIFFKNKERIRLTKTTRLLKRNRPNPVPKNFPSHPRLITIKKNVIGKGQPFFKLPTNIRHEREKQVAKKDGEKTMVGRLRAIEISHKNTNKRVSSLAHADAKYVAGSFENKKFVGLNKGWTRNALRR